MRIRFKNLTRVTAHLNICPRTGKSTQQIWEFDPNEEFDVHFVEYGPIKKVKTRPGRLGGRLRYAKITIKNENTGKQYPDYLDEVLETDFEIM